MNALTTSYRFRLSILALGSLAAVPLAAGAALDIPMVEIGAAGNASDREHYSGSAYGKVDYSYNIGASEVTNAQYAAFLNSVAQTDSLGLYNVNMAGEYGGISRSGVSGNYVYTVIAGKANNPVTYVSFFDAARFVNWLTNSATGGNSTERGVYDLTQGGMVVRDQDAWAAGGYAIASADEWYKAAYYNVEGGFYTLYATGNTIDPSQANYGDRNGNLTPVSTYGPEQNGTYGMMGNADELTETALNGGLEGRGGAFSAEAYWAAASTRAYYNLDSEAKGLGFRVSQLAFVPEPSTYAAIFSVVILGATLIRGRWRLAGKR